MTEMATSATATTGMILIKVLDGHARRYSEMLAHSPSLDGFRSDLADRLA